MYSVYGPYRYGFLSHDLRLGGVCVSYEGVDDAVDKLLQRVTEDPVDAVTCQQPILKIQEGLSMTNSGWEPNGHGSKRKAPGPQVLVYFSFYIP